ncbi:MAG: prepilin-type N-terminal cleavage/methylation domain-containing protein [Actinomycetia bacterium]|nr:prepilin-type N-terminal cleavage/methylation domain-containing protein [Actinomycetes bacterium]
MNTPRVRMPKRAQMGVAGDEAGFTLVEMVVALAIATALFTALAYAAIGALSATNSARANQEAADLANRVLEDTRQMSWGSLGHDPAGVDCSDARLSSCGGQAEYNGEELVQVAGGISGQVTQDTTNVIDYTVARYVTTPADETGDYRRVSVVVQWDDKGAIRERSSATVITESTRGLPLPDFTLTPFLGTGQEVNPGATAAWGFEITNQGAPDQWNMTTSFLMELLGVEFYLDNGDRGYSSADDTVPLVDNSSDGIVDTGLLDPSESIIVWAVFVAPNWASDGVYQAPVTATSVGQPGAASASQTVTLTLTITSGVISASPTPSTSPTGTESPTPTPTGVDNSVCTDTDPAPVPDAAGGYSRFEYVMHNSGNTSWPTFPLPATDPIPGSNALKPMALNQTADSIPSGRELSEYSQDLVPGGTPGRLLYAGGSFSSGTAQVADFQSGNQTKDYINSIALRTFVDQIPGGSADVTLSAELYEYKSSGNRTNTLGEVSTQVVSLSPYTCTSGFQEVSFNFPISGTMDLSNKYVLGVRIWNSGTETVRLAYDHEDYTSTLTVVEK